MAIERPAPAPHDNEPVSAAVAEDATDSTASIAAVAIPVRIQRSTRPSGVGPIAPPPSHRLLPCSPMALSQRATGPASLPYRLYIRLRPMKCLQDVSCPNNAENACCRLLILLSERRGRTLALRSDARDVQSCAVQQAVGLRVQDRELAGQDQQAERDHHGAAEADHDREVALDDRKRAGDALKCERQ